MAKPVKRRSTPTRSVLLQRGRDGEPPTSRGLFGRPLVYQWWHLVGVLVVVLTVVDVIHIVVQMGGNPAVGGGASSIKDFDIRHIKGDADAAHHEGMLYQEQGGGGGGDGGGGEGSASSLEGDGIDSKGEVGESSRRTGEGNVTSSSSSSSLTSTQELTVDASPASGKVSSDEASGKQSTSDIPGQATSAEASGQSDSAQRSVLSSGGGGGGVIPTGAQDPAKSSTEGPAQGGGAQEPAQGSNKGTTEQDATEMDTSEPSDPPSNAPILGSRLSTGAEAAAFRERWACLTSTRTAEWAYDPTPRILPWPKFPFRQCWGREGFLGAASNQAVKIAMYSSHNWPASESLKYVWRAKTPEACGKGTPSLEAFDAKGFCAALRRTNGSLFIVGDSITAHFFHSLRNQVETFGEVVKELPPTPACQAFMDDLKKRGEKGPLRGSWPACLHLLFCGETEETGGVQVHFAVSQYLQNMHIPEEEGKHQEELNWGDELVKHDASVVVVNRGAHFLGDHWVVPQLNETLKEIRRLRPEALLFFRATAAGHPNCTLHERPIKSPMRMSEWPFHWDEFGRQNQKAKSMVEGLGGLFLDVEHMTALRPDWHLHGPTKDCLHHCSPGPVDDWVKLFAKMLEELV